MRAPPNMGMRHPPAPPISVPSDRASRADDGGAGKVHDQPKTRRSQEPRLGAEDENRKPSRSRRSPLRIAQRNESIREMVL